MAVITKPSLTDAIAVVGSNGDDGYVGQPGGHSLVKTSCPVSQVFHLECITRYLVGQNEKGLEQHQCLCSHPALPLLRLGNIRDDNLPYCESAMFNVCRTGDLRELENLLRQDKTLATIAA